jgi:hypothetical protein
MENVRTIQLAFTRKIPLVSKTCPVCAKEFEGPRIRVYCSKPCAKKAQWARGGKKWNANRRARSGHTAEE